MKTNKFLSINLLFFFCIVILTSCENDDNGADTEFSYFPIAVNNSWNYDVTSDSETESDQLSVTSTTAAGFELEANPVEPNAFMTGVLSNLTLEEVDGTLRGNGSFQIDLGELNGPDVSIQNAILFDQNASNGRTLFELNRIESQQVDGNDLTFSYTISTVQKADLASLEVSGTTYDDVLHSQLIIEAAVITTQDIAGTSIDIDLLLKQDVLVIDNYWAQDVGMIKSESEFSYELVDFSGFGISFPIEPSVEVLTEQNLTSFLLN